jgi:integrase
MLVLLVRLGLRAGEVAAARLEDVDWRQGEILVRGKGGRCERLPLPVDVGRALADYCHRGRPRRSGERALFLQVRAPYGPVSRDVVSEVVRRACGRAGLPCVGAHRLRHTAASALRREGAPLVEIGRVLRHRHQATTAIYATIEAEELRALAREWPGGRA